MNTSNLSVHKTTASAIILVAITSALSKAEWVPTKQLGQYAFLDETVEIGSSVFWRGKNKPDVLYFVLAKNPNTLEERIKDLKMALRLDPDICDELDCFVLEQEMANI